MTLAYDIFKKAKKSDKISSYFKKSASIQPRTSPPRWYYYILTSVSPRFEHQNIMYSGPHLRAWRDHYRKIRGVFGIVCAGCQSIPFTIWQNGKNRRKDEPKRKLTQRKARKQWHQMPQSKADLIPFLEVC